MTTEIEITKVSSGTPPTVTVKVKPKTKTKTKGKRKTMKGARAKAQVETKKGVAPLFTNAEVAKRLFTFKTVRELATALKVTPPAALNYVNKLKEDMYKLDRKTVRQGDRGPLATAYKVR